MPRLALYLFGTPRIELDSVPISLSHNKAVAFLAYLSLTRQHHTRLALAALLWPDHDPANARRELRRIIWVVNKQLGPAWLELDHQTVSLPPQPDLWLDVDQFREWLVECKQHGHPATEVCPACLEPLTQAVALAQGELLAGFSLPDSPDFDLWQTFETESLQRERVGALQRLVTLLAQGGAGAIEQALTYARRWLVLDPLHEPAQRQLMQLYTWSGQPVAALQQYQSCVQLLEQELGLSPAAETTALFEAIKANRLPPPPGPTKPPQAVPLSLVASPESRPPPHNLQPQTTPFIGREDVLDDLQQRLSDPEVRLITIVGPGGIGKTRLALALAMRQLKPSPLPEPSFADGVYFIALAPLSSAEVIAQTIAEAIALPLISTQEPAIQLVTYLRHRRMLLILDNFEHVMSGTSLVSQLLQTAAGVKVVATSRERLNLANEILWPISGLNFAELASVEEALTYEAVRLFVQCARRVRPDFVLRAEELPHLERLLQGVWGMPLAIELAATWLNMLSVAEIAAELSHSLDFLDSNMRDMPERHRSMRAVFDHSWSLLSDEEQKVLRQLSVFKGGFRREAAEAVAGANLRILSRLLNKSLLRRSHKGHYDLHELIRQYAAERLHAEIQEEHPTRDRHSHYYLTLLQLCERALTSHRQIETLAELNAEIDNLRTAWNWTVDRQQLDLMRRAAWSLWYFYELRNYSQEGEAVLRRAAEMVQALRMSLGANSPEHERAKLAGTLGELQAHQAFFSLRQGHRHQTRTLFESSISLLRPLQEPAMLAHALAHYGAFYWNIGQYDHAAHCLAESLEISRALRQPWSLAIFTSFMGVVIHEQGNYDEAYRLLDEAMAYARSLGDPRLISFIGSFLSRTALGLGRLDEVQGLLREGLRLVRETGDRFGTGLMLERLAVAAQISGDAEEAHRLFAECITLYRDIDDPWSLSRVLNLQGHFLLSSGDEAQARPCFEQALHLALTARIDPNTLDALTGLALLSERAGCPETALEMALYVLQHPASTQDAKDRAEKLRGIVTPHLSQPQQAETQARAQARPLTLAETVAELLP